MRIIGAYLMGCGLMVVLGGRLNQKQRVVCKGDKMSQPNKWTGREWEGKKVSLLS